MAKIIRAYKHVLDKHPLKTQALTTGILMGSGDVVSQFCFEKKSLASYEFPRTVRFFIFGTVILGPTLRKWYGILETVFTRPPPIGLAAKIAADQLIFAPTFLAFFLGSMTLWTTQSVELTRQKITQDYKSVLMTNYKLWPCAQLINFYFVPLQYRVLYTNFIALIWNTYLANNMAHQATSSSDTSTEASTDSSSRVDGEASP